jgi:hypothetical protein
VHYALRADEWGARPFQAGQLAVIGNVLKLGPDSDPGMPLVLIEGEGPLELEVADNLVLDRSGARLDTVAVRDDAGLVRGHRARPWSGSITLLPASQVLERVLQEAGARPWDRDAADLRILEEVRSGEGRIIDAEEDVGGYPPPTPGSREAAAELR